MFFWLLKRKDELFSFGPRYYNQVTFTASVLESVGKKFDERPRQEFRINTQYGTARFDLPGDVADVIWEFARYLLVQVFDKIRGGIGDEIGLNLAQVC